MSSISYIVPCYNASKTITRCLDSIRVGGGDDYEIIVVDDCSKDNSIEILQKYHNDIEPRLIIVKNASNVGAGASRNIGVSMSTKDYVTFVDSDDTIDNGFYSTLRPLLDSNYDAVIFDATRVVSEKKLYYKSLFSRRRTKGDIESKEALVFAKGSVWGKIYRREIITKNCVKFATIPRNEDLVFTKIALSYCKKVFYLNHSLYNYIDNAESLMHNTNLLTTSNAFKAYELINKALRGKGFEEELKSIYMIEIIYATTLTTIRLGNDFSNINKHYKNVAGYFVFKNKYFGEYSFKYIVIIYMMRMKLFNIIKILV